LYFTVTTNGLGHFADTVRTGLPNAKFKLNCPLWPFHPGLGYGLTFAAEEAFLSPQLFSPHYLPTNMTGRVELHPVALITNPMFPPVLPNPFRSAPYWRKSTNLFSGIWVSQIKSADIVEFHLFTLDDATMWGEVQIFVNGNPWKHAEIKKQSVRSDMVLLTHLEDN
jgi:hypothetical protein